MIDFAEISSFFKLDGEYTSCTPHGTGHIHDTYILETRTDGNRQKYILQRLNTSVFRKPEALQDNLRRILSFLKKEKPGSPGNGVIDIELIEARDGNNYIKDRFRNYWRCLKYIENSHILEKVGTAEQAYEGARMFGLFISRLKNYNARRLHITIPDFLNIELRLRQLLIAQMAGRKGRMKLASAEYNRILEKQFISRHFTRLRHALPDRVTHNDAKISNVLFSNKTGRGICVIDLDTVMTGTLLTDFGDMVRTFTAESEEDEKNTERIRCNPSLFEGVAGGFMAGLGGLITPVEKANLLLGAKVMIYMQAVRFLTDYLNGDVYYKRSYPGQNLDRARNQLSLLDSLLEKEEQLEGILKKNL